MFAGQNNNQQQNRDRAQALIERVQNARNNTNANSGLEENRKEVEIG